MTKIEFPPHLEALLKDSAYLAPLQALADQTVVILADNKLPFFPDYTDHGIEHINRVLATAVELIPDEVWQANVATTNHLIFNDADATVLVGAALLHDFAMHLRENGFLELIHPGSRFRPVPWFEEKQTGYSGDRPWADLWADYAREVRRFSDRKLAEIIGLDEVRNGWKFDRLPDSPAQWEGNHKRVIGEFIRRHHARLAHEIALHGFPGAPVGEKEHEFPAMGERGHKLNKLADLIGLTARSHGLSLRVCTSYLDAYHPGTPRPMGTAVLYPMALLRVADYLQMDEQRAPAILLQLRNPQSPVSLKEWKKHRAVQNIGPARNPRGKHITVSDEISLETCLQLRELLDGLQNEMDHATSVLDEAYGLHSHLKLHLLTLRYRRVYSNLDDPGFRDRLPYLAERTGFSTDPNLLTLLVEPLYGKEPGVGVRELMQNAVDAVRELHAWCEAHGKDIASIDLLDQEADVLIDFIKRDDGSWSLRVADKGIGMTADTLKNYFLRAGASFRQSTDWAREFLDDAGKPQVLRAGRFGIGAFATFLLGSEFRLRTRHVSAPEDQGYELEASVDSQLIEIRRKAGLVVGTTIDVELAEDVTIPFNWAKQGGSLFSGYGSPTDWYCLSWPRVVRQVSSDSTQILQQQRYCFAENGADLWPEWYAIFSKGYDAVYWTFSPAPDLVCNGMRIGKPDGWSRCNIGWPSAAQLNRPNISVVDTTANLPLTTQRYDLAEKPIPFVNELIRDVTLSFIAHTLVCGPKTTDETMAFPVIHPLCPEPFSRYELRQWMENSYFAEGLLRWCSTASQMVPADPCLFQYLGATKTLVFGAADVSDYGFEFYIPEMGDIVSALVKGDDIAYLHWHLALLHEELSHTDWENASELFGANLVELACRGVRVLGHSPKASFVCASVCRDIDLGSGIKSVGEHLYLEEDESNFDWEISRKDGTSRRFLAMPGQDVMPAHLIKLLDEFESVLSRNRSQVGLPSLLFAAEIHTPLEPKEPETPLAEIWNECLGPTAIPFDPAARQALIKKGRQHPELKRHIEAWEEMKRSGSEWANYRGE